MGRRSIRIGRQRQSFHGNPGTRVFALIGHPVKHSLSPRFQQAALQAAGIDAVYLAADVESHGLDEAWSRLVEAAAAGTLAGVNVTRPHKQAVAARVHQVDEVARQAGAVNVLRFAGSGDSLVVHGHNTDVEGLQAALADAGRSMTGAAVVIVGAGGMARAALVAAVRSGAAEIRVLARRPERAANLLQGAAAAWEGRLPVLRWDALDGPRRRAFLEDAAVLVQCTSLGLRPREPSPVSLAGASPEMFVLESIYDPGETTLLREARAAGLAAANGRSLLLHQGAAAFRLWTGREPDLGVMRRSLGLA